MRRNVKKSQKVIQMSTICVYKCRSDKYTLDCQLYTSKVSVCQTYKPSPAHGKVDSRPHAEFNFKHFCFNGNSYRHTLYWRVADSDQQWVVARSEAAFMWRVCHKRTPASMCPQIYTICCQVINYSYLCGGIHDLVAVMYSYWICFSAICRPERQHALTMCQLLATFTQTAADVSSYITVSCTKTRW